MKKKNALVTILTATLLALTVSGCSDTQGTSREPAVVQTVDVVDMIMNTYSAKEFTDVPVADADLEKVLLSGAKAPSARNSQSWFFTVVKNQEIASAIANASTAGTVTIVISGAVAEEEGINVDFDCALAVENMYIAAQSLGLGAHIYTGPVQSINEEYQDALGIPDGYEAVSLLLIGNVESREDAVAAASQRNHLDDIVNYVE